MDIPHHFRSKTAPVAHPDAVITFATMRITVLTERLLRLEYAADGQFEDRTSQVGGIANNLCRRIAPIKTAISLN